MHQEHLHIFNAQLALYPLLFVRIFHTRTGRREHLNNKRKGSLIQVYVKLQMTSVTKISLLEEDCEELFL